MTRDDLFEIIRSDMVGSFCLRWKIRVLSIFGSALRDDFGPDSDVDVLVTFDLSADWSLFDHMQMQEELEAILGRKVDLVNRRAIERSPNWIRRDAILGSAETVYVAG
jgi:predicted nucleotidyltransferase